MLTVSGVIEMWSWKAGLHFVLPVHYPIHCRAFLGGWWIELQALLQDLESLLTLQLRVMVSLGFTRLCPDSQTARSKSICG